jgi:DNA-binding GntR family transcriptional regulator
MATTTRSKDTAKRKKAEGPRGEFVYEQLFQKIKTGALQPGERLLEVELAESLGVSRTPVREALRRLRNEGMITLVHSRTLVVTQLTHVNVMDLYSMREVLVGTAARFAAERASPLEIEHLKQILAQQKTLKNPLEAAAMDRRLHEAIVEAAHNSYLSRAMDVLSNAISLLGTTTYSAPGRVAAGFKENQTIVASIAARDATAAEDAARHHIRSASAVRVGLLFGGGSGQRA